MASTANFDMHRTVCHNRSRLTRVGRWVRVACQPGGQPLEDAVGLGACDAGETQLGADGGRRVLSSCCSGSVVCEEDEEDTHQRGQRLRQKTRADDARWGLVHGRGGAGVR